MSAARRRQLAADHRASGAVAEQARQAQAAAEAAPNQDQGPGSSAKDRPAPANPPITRTTRSPFGTFFTYHICFASRSSRRRADMAHLYPRGDGRAFGSRPAKKSPSIDPPARNAPVTSLGRFRALTLKRHLPMATGSRSAPLRAHRPPASLRLQHHRRAEAAARRRGEDIIDLSMGNPDGATPPHIVAKLVRGAQRPDTHGYSASKGIPRLRRAISHWYRDRYGVEIDPEREAIVTIGSKEGPGAPDARHAGPRRHVLVPDPSYPIHIYGAVIAGADIRSVPNVPGVGLLRRARSAPSAAATPSPR
jgi:hypothetical protein